MNLSIHPNVRFRRIKFVKRSMSIAGSIAIVRTILRFSLESSGNGIVLSVVGQTDSRSFRNNGLESIQFADHILDTWWFV